MEITINTNPSEMIQPVSSIPEKTSSSFIEANTLSVSLEHLKKDCIIPVFSKDNESTISHFQFINKTYELAQDLFPELNINEPNIRVSHIVKGRVPSAIGKPAKELREDEKTIYYERCAFLIDIPDVKQMVNGNELNLSIGGVRAYNQENLYSKKSLEKFKVFVGFKNRVCTNLCISTDGFSNDIRISNVLELKNSITQLLANYDKDNHVDIMEKMSTYYITERQFAHFIGKARMYQHLNKQEQTALFQIKLNDSQINSVVKDYYQCPNFSRQRDGTISLWNLYNIFTEANKSSYIDSNLERNVNTYALIQELGNSVESNQPNWFLP